MPELPEVETIKKELEKNVIGKKISDIKILSKKQFKDDPLLVIGTKIKKLYRQGKILSMKLSNDKFLNFHLKLSGQVMYADDMDNADYDYEIPLTGGAKKLPAKSTRVIIEFNDGSGLFFNESRKFGWIKITDKQEKQKGIDIMSADFTLDYFKSKLTKTRRAIKLVLLDQNLFAGIGNIYANEILFDAMISPIKPANEIVNPTSSLDKLGTTLGASKLYKSILKIIKQGIKYNGSSGKDDNYVLPNGSRGKYQQHFKVYQRQGKECYQCGSIIKRIKQGGRGTFFCPKCQE